MVRIRPGLLQSERRAPVTRRFGAPPELHAQPADTSFPFLQVPSVADHGGKPNNMKLVSKQRAERAKRRSGPPIRLQSGIPSLKGTPS